VLPVEITPQEVKQMLESGEALTLIDVREPFEHQTARIEGADLVPMRTVPQALDGLKERGGEAPLVVFCHHGVRSLQVAAFLRRRGIANARSLEGGIDLWSRTVDPAVPRY
jgi:rhodanese-related sulfurtransferase